MYDCRLAPRLLNSAEAFSSMLLFHLAARPKPAAVPLHISLMTCNFYSHIVTLVKLDTPPARLECTRVNPLNMCLRLHQEHLAVQEVSKCTEIGREPAAPSESSELSPSS